MIYHRAGFILNNDFSIIRNGAVGIKDGVILDIRKDLKGLDKKNIIDHGSGIIMPGVFNCHTHLELSFLKNRMDYLNGFKSWVKDLISIREKTPDLEIITCIKNEVNNLENSGTIGIGDISSIELSRDIFFKSPLKGFFFYEELGMEAKFLDENLEEKVSFAAHAPHTTAPELIKKIKSFTEKKSIPFSIHCGESDDELEFITSKKGDWALFLNSRNIDYTSWPVPEKSSVIYLDKLGVLNEKTLIVHLINYLDKDLEIIRKNKASICVCPSSNKNLHGKLPDIEGFLNAGIDPCIGTDSLASCESLDVFCEMKFIKDNYKSISPEKIIEMATINGAKALLMDNDSGSIETGKKSDLIYLDIPGKEIFDEIIFSKPDMRKRIQ